MKILQICAAYKPAYVYGGPTMSVSMLSEQLVRAGIYTEVYATTANGKRELEVSPGECINVDGVNVTYFARYTKDHSHFSPGLLKKVWVSAMNFDVVHIHAWWNLVSVFSCLLALLRHIPVVVSPRGTLSPYSFQNKNIGPKWAIHKILGEKLLNKCHIHVTSEREKEAVMKLINPKSVIHLPNFVSLPGVPKLHQNSFSPILRILFFSRIEQKKGLDILFDALKMVSVPYYLTIAGDGDKTYVDYLKTKASNNNISDKINWLGFYSGDKICLFNDHDLFVLPSYDENFGNSVIESLCAGTPVLISEQVGLADYVKKNNLGWLCQTNAVSLSQAINNITENCREDLGRIRKQAPGIIYRDFNPGNLVEKYINMYDQIIKA